MDIHVVTDKISGPINRRNHCGVIFLWTWQFWSHPVTMASVIFIFHLKVLVVVNSCCCLVRILYFYSSYEIEFWKFWKSLRTDGYVERVLVNDLRWINSFTVFTIHRTTKDLYKSTDSYDVAWEVATTTLITILNEKTWLAHYISCILTVWKDTFKHCWLPVVTIIQQETLMRATEK